MAGSKQQKKQAMQQMPFRYKHLSMLITTMLYGVTGHAQQLQLNLPSQSIGQSIQQLARQSGTEIVVATDQLKNQTAPRVQGNMSVAEALSQLLQNRALELQQQGNVYVIADAHSQPNAAPTASLIRSESDAVVVALQPIQVSGDKARDPQGYDDVYDKNFSSNYAGKELIERFQGTTPSDLFKGMSNVYSGDARNSGALDPNIRGLQGQGRVPVTIDGTEQSLTVWRGYNGANSRSYIDPNLLSSIQVVKGASLSSNIKTGIAGGVAATTLQADDVVRAGEKYGAEIKVEGSNNSVDPRLPKSYEGRDYRDVMDELGKVGWTNVYEDPLTNVQPKRRADESLLDLDDRAFRIALATKQEQFDLLAAYAYRGRGNYFAGRNGSDYFNGSDQVKQRDNVMVPYMAKYFKPNAEVTNSSNEMDSYLLKGTWRPSDDQAVQLVYRNSKNTYGEIMPSRIWWHTMDGLPQWPLSEVKSEAYNLEYKLNPFESRWIDLKLNLWQTNTDTKTYSSGGFVNTVLGDFDFVYSTCHPNPDLLTESQLETYRRYCETLKEWYGTDRNPNKSYPIVNTAFNSATNTRKGVSISNTLQLTNTLQLSLGADLSKEKLSSEDEFINDRSDSGAVFRMLPRAGRRAENQYHFNFNWQPSDWFSMTAGAKSVSYWSFDDFLHNNLGNEGIPGLASYEKEVAQKLFYTWKVDNYTEEMFEDELAKGNFRSNYFKEKQAREAIGKPYEYTQTEYWYPDENGKYSAATNPFINGQVKLPYDQIDENTYYGSRPVYEMVKKTSVEKKKDRKNWAPALSAVFSFNPNNRLYINYNEAYRLPSLFETTLGFSASQSGSELKPEHAKNWEIAYVYNMADILKLDHGMANIKLAYFNNKTNDVIERNRGLVFSNVDQQKIAGWELASRYDNGKIFGDISLVWNKQNKVCDESSSLLEHKDRIIGRVRDGYCVNYGFTAGYLVNMALPEYQANINLGTRIFDNKLELGTRIAYFEGFENPYLNTYQIAWINQPLQWRDTWTYDAYMHYQHNKNLAFDVIATNLSNEYYLDPISRSATPAPGRTLKLGMNYKF